MLLRNRAVRTLLTACFASLVFSTAVFAQRSLDRVWSRIDEASIGARGQRHITPAAYRTFRLNASALQTVFNSAPLENTQAARMTQAVITLPDPHGNYVRFRLEETPLLSPEIAAQFPTWKTFQGYGIDDPTATARFDWTDAGFHGYILSSNGSFFVDPYQMNDLVNYQVYYKTALSPRRQFHCKLDEVLSGAKTVEEVAGSSLGLPAPEFSHGAQVRTYRLGIATTFEFTNLFPSQAAALAAVVTTVNRVSGAYRKDLAVAFTLVSGTNMIFNVNPESPADYANSGSPDLSANVTNMNSILGPTNYDVGHVFGSSDNGIASLSSVCTSNKASGYSGQPNPVGDGFDIDYVAHEMGHQFGANHTFNTQANCNSVPAGSRKEAGSAVTIMGYAGICSGNSDVARHSIDTFHVHSQTEAINFLAGTGGSCGTLAGTNAIPVIGALTNFTIPFNTPFTLSATATDGDSNPLTYSWEQNDPSAALASYPGTTDDDDTSLVFRPGFRSYLPTASGTRTFPSLPYILANGNEAPVFFSDPSQIAGVVCGNDPVLRTCITGEDLPSAARTMNFRVTVRDGQGGVADAGTVLSVINTTTPFRVTAPNTAVTYAGGSAQNVTWDVSGTSGAPISTASVKISMSTDGGNTFPTVLAASTPNDGTESVTIPLGNTTTARIKVEAVGNIFFDVSNTNFTVSGVAAPPRSRADFDADGKTDLSIFRPSTGEWWLNRTTDGFQTVVWGVNGDIPAPGFYDTDAKVDVAVFRPSNGTFYIINSATSTVTGVAWGQSGDVPVVGDYDGDTRADVAVWRPTSSTWYVLKSGGGFDITPIASSGNKAMAGDFDGDGKSDKTVFNAGTWTTRQSSGGTFTFGFGTGTDLPVPADYNGDNIDEFAYYRPATGVWSILDPTGLKTFTYGGVAGDLPVPGDYDGDGKDDLAVYRSGTWHRLLSGAAPGPVQSPWGLATDSPIPRGYIPN